MSGSGKTFFKSTVGQHPVFYGGLMVAMGLALIFLLAWAVAKGSNKSGFLTQYPYTGMHSQWWLGGGDAGWGGSLQRETTPAQASVYHPGWRPVGLERAICNSGREGLAVAPPLDMSALPAAATAGAGPGCSGGCGPSIPCRPGWDPSATAEAQALATLGSLPHDAHAEATLQGAVNAAFDCDSGLDDNQLRDIMHSGGAP